MRAFSFQSPIRLAQGGAALVTAMIFMVIILMLGFSILTTTNTEEKTARNFRDYDIAYAAAEAALRDAELHVSGAWKWPYQPADVTLFDASCTNGLCNATTSALSPSVDKLDFYDSAAPAMNSVVIGSVTGSPQISGVPSGSQPRYLVEMTCTTVGSLTGVTCSKVFRITAQGRGRLPNTRVMLQEIYILPALAS